MILYNLTIQRSTAINHVVLGNFSGTKQQEIAVSHGKSLELFQINTNTGRISTLLAVEIFGIIRSMINFRPDGKTKDYIAIGSDSGKLVIVEYNPLKNMFEKIYQSTIGKSGCRRTVPGQFLAIDSKSRVLITAAMEEQKLIYFLTEDPNVGLITSSPLESSKSTTFLYDMVGIDNGKEKPMFACLEMDYQEADNDPFGENTGISRQNLTFYEVDTGQVVQKCVEELEDRGNALIAIPGGSCGPGGILVCSENFITYKTFPPVQSSLKQEHRVIRCPIPRRRMDIDYSGCGMIIVCSAVYKTEFAYFVLGQTEQGDVFKISLETTENVVTGIKLKYLDTLAVASAMCILKTGFLFVASEFGNHYLYQIGHLEGNDNEPEFNSSLLTAKDEMFHFIPHTLQNLILVDELKSLAPIMHCEISGPLDQEKGRLYVACGRGPRSSLRVHQSGLRMKEVGTCFVPEKSNAVWAAKRKCGEKFDSYIVVASDEEILLLSVEKIVTNIENSLFLTNTTTLSCVLVGEDLVQIHSGGIRKIKGSGPMNVAKMVGDWRDVGKKAVAKCATNERQMIIALVGGSLAYFEVDDDDNGNLAEFTLRKKLRAEVQCMAMAGLLEGEKRTGYIAVGLVDNTVCIISSDLENFLNIVSELEFHTTPESLIIVRIDPDKAFDSDRGGQNMSYLNIGLQNGELVTTILNLQTGELCDKNSTCLGTDPVVLMKVTLQGNEAFLALSSDSWLSYYYGGEFHLMPLICPNLDYVCSFCSEQCPEGILVVSGNTMRILSFENFGEMFPQITSFEHTPRKFVVHPESSNLIIVETDHNAYTEKMKQARKQKFIEDMVESATQEKQEAVIELATAFMEENISEAAFGAPKAGPDTWASLIRILNPDTEKTLFKVPLKQDLAAFSIAIVPFDGQGQQFLLVGVAKNLHLQSLHCECGYIQSYNILDDGNRLSLLHETLVDGIPLVICPFKGRVLIGVGNALNLYDMGKRKLLKKCGNKTFPNQIVAIDCIENRIVVGDIEKSMFFVNFKSSENIFLIFAEDTNLRPLTAACLLDCDTVACADKLGNISVLRLPTAVSNKMEANACGVRTLENTGHTDDSVGKIETVASFYIGEMVSSLQKATLISTNHELLLYTTISGAIGVLVCFTAYEDTVFFQHLESHMQLKHSPLCGRDHLAFRSYYFSVKNVIDGDLCEQFQTLCSEKQDIIAKCMDCESSEILKRLENIRKQNAF